MEPGNSVQQVLVRIHINQMIPYGGSTHGFQIHPNIEQILEIGRQNCTFSVHRLPSSEQQHYDVLILGLTPLYILHKRVYQEGVVVATLNDGFMRVDGGSVV